MDYIINSDGPQVERPIKLAIQRLGKAQEETRALIDSIEARLSDAMEPHKVNIVAPPDNIALMKQVGSPISPLANSLQLRIESAEMVNKILASILSRLEI